MSMRLAQQVVRNLKRRYPAVGAVYRPIENTHDVLTGQVSRDYDVHVIKKMILLPTVVAKEFIYDSSYSKGASGFSYGAFYTTVSRSCLIDVKDISVEPNEYDHIVADGTRYEIQRVESSTRTDLGAYLITVKAVAGVDPYTPDVRAMITAGLDARILTLLALDKLALDIRFDVFGGTVDPDFEAVPICGNTLTDASIKMFVSGSVVPSTAVEDEYVEYGVNGGIDNADFETDSGLAYSYYNDTRLLFLAGGLTLSGPQETALDTAVSDFNTLLGREP